MAIADNLQWVRKTLPFNLTHINCWLLQDEDGLTIVDTGVDTPQGRAEWERALSTHTLPLRCVLCTHMHPDHIGLAGWLVRKHKTQFMISRSEYLMCRTLVADTGRNAPDEALVFYRSAGFSEDELESYQSRFGGFGSMVSQLPDTYRRLQGGQTLQIGGYSWQTIATGGHSPEHICLYCREHNLLIAGDQLLPGITPNVSVWPTEPQANPLGEWLDGCRHLKDSIDRDCLVLPSHGKPFYGAHQRIQYIIDMHIQGLEQITAQLQRPTKVTELFSTLFHSRISESNRIMAAGETIAHLNYLVAQEQIGFEIQSDGSALYSRL